MKTLSKLFNIKTILNIVPWLLLLAYFFYITNLPLFGDAATHGFQSLNLLEYGLSGVETKYPPLYYYIMNSCYLILGEIGFNIVPFFGILLAVLFSMLIVRYISKGDKILLIISFMMIFLSTKILYYGSRMYMEVFMTGFFLVGLYLFLRYLNRKSLKYLILLLIITGFLATIKQQGLFNFFAPLVGFFIVATFLGYTKKKHLFLSLLLPVVIMLPGYGYLFHSYGNFVAGNNSIGVLNVINYVGQEVFDYRGVQVFDSISDAFATKEIHQKYFDEKPDVEKFAKSLEEIRVSKNDKKNSASEARSVRFSDLLNPNVLNNFHQTSFSENIVQIIFILFLIFGVIGLVRGGREQKWSGLFLLLFLLSNYLLMGRNTDQVRYHVFLPFMINIVIFYGMLYFKSFAFHKYIFLLLTSGLLFNFSGYANEMRDWKMTQIYAPSIGGISSIKETGERLKNTIEKTGKEANVRHACGNEMRYYSHSSLLEFKRDRRHYFLEESEIVGILESDQIDYLVVLKSQLVSNRQWKRACSIPHSFHNFIKSEYPLVYISSKDDVYVYKIR